MALWWHHHVVEVLGEHCRGKKGDRAQRQQLDSWAQARRWPHMGQRPKHVARSHRQPNALGLQQRFSEQLGHVLWVRAAEVGNLMPATCA